MAGIVQFRSKQVPWVLQKEMTADSRYF